MNVENNREDWLLWQISDSALPTGGFVASSGLESAIQTGYVHDIPSLSIFLSSSIDNYAFSSLPFVTGSWNIGNTNNEEEEEDKDVILRKIMELDDLYDSCTSNHVAKRASKAQGVAMLILFSKSFNKGEGETAIVKDKENQKNGNNNDDDDDNDNNDDNNDSRFNDKIVEDFKLNVRKELACGHLPVCFGLVTRYLGISLEKTQHLYLFLFARAIISAAVRLNIIGPYYSQRMLTECCQVYVENSLKKTCNIKVNDASQTSPLLDILQGRHDKLYSRLFNS